MFECASMVSLFSRNALLDENDAQILLKELDQLSRMITAFRSSLK